MSDQKREQLHPGQMMPDFEFHSIEGKPVRLSLFRNRYNLVLIFPDPEEGTITPDYQSHLSALEDDFREENTRVLIAISGQPSRDTPDHFLFDRSGDAYKTVSTAEFLRRPGSVAVIVDRFGEIDAIFRQVAGEPLPPGDVLLEEIRFIELQCPE